MAKLDTKSAPGQWTPLPGESWSDCYTRGDGILQALQEASDKIDPAGRSLKGALLAFPIADGAAYYLVTKDRPLTLAHIPHADAWHIPGSHMRGINASDVRQQLGYNNRLAALIDSPANKKQS